MLGIPLLWPCFMATEISRTKEVKHPVNSHLRAKRGWMWNQFFVPEEMNKTKYHIGQVLILSVLHEITLYESEWMG